jgi:hypothetical protein
MARIMGIEGGYGRAFELSYGMAIRARAGGYARKAWEMGLR